MILAGAHQQAVALRHHLDGRFLVGAVGIAVGIRADQLVAGNRYFLRVAASDLDVAARIVENDPVHAGGWAVHRNRIVVLLPEPVRAEDVPPDAVLVRLPDPRPGQADQNYQHHLTAGEAVAASLPAPYQGFNQPQQPPGDQHERPVGCQKIENRRFRMQVPP